MIRGRVQLCLHAARFAHLRAELPIEQCHTEGIRIQPQRHCTRRTPRHKEKNCDLMLRPRREILAPAVLGGYGKKSRKTEQKLGDRNIALCNVMCVSIVIKKLLLLNAIIDHLLCVLLTSSDNSVDFDNEADTLDQEGVLHRVPSLKPLQKRMHDGTKFNSDHHEQSQKVKLEVCCLRSERHKLNTHLIERSALPPPFVL